MGETSAERGADRDADTEDVGGGFDSARTASDAESIAGRLADSPTSPPWAGLDADSVAAAGAAMNADSVAETEVGTTSAPPLAALILAAGFSRRFGGGKLHLPLPARLGGGTLLSRVLADAAGLAPCLVAVQVDDARATALALAHGAQPVPVPLAERGQAESLKAGVRALLDWEAAQGCRLGGVLIFLGDAPLLGAPRVERLLHAFTGGWTERPHPTAPGPVAGLPPCHSSDLPPDLSSDLALSPSPVSSEDSPLAGLLAQGAAWGPALVPALAPGRNGRRDGHPVLLPRRAFADLLTLEGDAGARELLRDYGLRLVPVDDTPPCMDVDTLTDYMRLCQSPSVPDEAASLALFGRYNDMPHIAVHCDRVARFAVALALRAVELGRIGPESLGLTLAGGLLHDIAKAWCIRRGGNHAQLGAALVRAETGNPLLARIVLRHVEWPGPLPASVCDPVFFVSYADKRVQHDGYVSLGERYADLLDRYGSTAESRAGIRAGYEQAQNLERALTAQLELQLDACALAGGRLVPRA